MPKKLLAGFLIALYGFHAPLLFAQENTTPGSSTSQGNPTLEEFEDELNALDQKIQKHLDRAEAKDFWSKDHSTPPSQFDTPSPKPEVIPPTQRVSGPSTTNQAVPSRVVPVTTTSPSTEEALDADMDAVDEELQSRVRVSGNYRLAFGVGRNQDFTANESNPDYQDRDSNYLFGEHLENTFDPRIYNQYVVDIEADLTDRSSLFVELAADPWSYVGKTSEIKVSSTNNQDHFMLQRRYWGPNDSTLPENIFTHTGNLVRLPLLEANDGMAQGLPQARRGFTDFNTTYRAIPEQEIDYEFRPLRKVWWDYEADRWQLRLFPLADQSQVMNTDDPLGLSGTKDFWEPSPWLYNWEPLKRFSNGSVLRGSYSDTDAFEARHSDGSYMTLLRGASFEADLGSTYLGGMVASRYGLWDEYQEFDNVPGVFRIKQQLTPDWMVGGTYTYRAGLVDREMDSINQVFSGDTRYQIAEESFAYLQYAASTTDSDRLQTDSLNINYEGHAYRGGFQATFGTPETFLSKLHTDFTWMDTKFQPALANYTNLRDDEFWGRYGSFTEFSHDLEPFRIGTGVDRGRYVGRIAFKTTMPEKGMDYLFDLRHVRDSDSNSFIENVLRNEMTLQVTPQIKLLGMNRWHVLPNTTNDIEPSMSSFVANSIVDPADPKLSDIQLQNFAIDEGRDPSRATFSGGVEYEPREQWNFQFVYNLTNDYPDFSRGLMHDVYVNTPLRDLSTAGYRLYRLQPFLYFQEYFDTPPYDYFSIVTERITYEPISGLKFIFHAAQNGNRFWGPVDEFVNHQGLSIDFQIDEKWSLFFDYTHSKILDAARAVDTDFNDVRIDDHHNIYAVLAYKMNEDTKLNFEYGVFGKTFYEGSDAIPTNPYAVSSFYLPTVDTEHLFRLTLEGEF